MFGQSTNRPLGGFGQSSTLGQSQSQPSFGQQSTFGTSTVNANSSFGSLGNTSSLSQSQSSFFNADVSSSGPSSFGLSHSQSAYDLRTPGAAQQEHNAPLTPGFRSSRGAPSWTSNDRRFVPSHLSALKQKSSFYAEDRTPERSASFSRRTSTSPNLKSSLSKAGGESPPSGVGGSSFGTPKPTGTKKQTHTITEEELPPVQSIYDSGGSPFSAARRGTGNGTPGGAGLRRSETFNPSSARKSLRATASFNNHANTPRKAPAGDGPNLAVVVFGFPQHLTPSIVAHFKNFGDVLENMESGDTSFSHTPIRRPNRQPVVAGKNWIKLTYDNKASVIRALAEDGTQFAGQYVIGCKPYSASQVRDFDVISASMLESGDVSEVVQDTPIRAAPAKSNLYPNLSRTTSMPVLNGGAQRLEIRDGTNTVFKQASTKSITNPKVNKKTGTLGKTGWLSWTAKRAEELIFGYEV